MKAHSRVAAFAAVIVGVMSLSAWICWPIASAQTPPASGSPSKFSAEQPIGGLPMPPSANPAVGSDDEFSPFPASSKVTDQPRGAWIYEPAPTRGLNSALQKLREAKGEEEKQAARAILRGELVKIFVADMKAREGQIREAELRLERLRSQMQEREKSQDKIIDLQLKAAESARSDEFPKEAIGGKVGFEVPAYIRAHEGERADDIQWLVVQLAKLGVRTIGIGRSSAKDNVVEIFATDSLPAETKERLKRELRSVSDKSPIKYSLNLVPSFSHTTSTVGGPTAEAKGSEDLGREFLLQQQRVGGVPSGVRQSDDAIRTEIKKLKLFEVHASGDSLDTSRVIVFQGKLGKSEVRPGTSLFVELPRPTKEFHWSAGDAPEGIGDAELPVKFTHVWCRWETNGKLTWKCFGPDELK